MQFRSITINDFRSHAATTLELAPLSVIRGANCVGKSSLKDAIELTLTGRTSQTSSDGKGSVGLIRLGEKKASIGLTVTNGTDERLIQAALNGTAIARLVTDPANPSYQGGTEYVDFLNGHRETLSCLCNNRYFVDLPAKEQATILSAIILPKTYEWPEWLVPAVNAAGLAVKWSSTPFEIIEAGYAAAYAARTNIGRDIKNLVIPEGNVSDADNLADFSGRLTQRRGELEALIAKDSARTAKTTADASTLAEAQRRLKASQERLEREQRTAETMQGRVVTPAKVKELEKTAKQAAHAKEIESQIVAYDEILKRNRADLAELNSLSEEPVCPTCQSTITGELVAKLAAPLTAAINETGSLRDVSIAARKALGNPEEAAASLREHQQATEALTAAKGRISDEQTAINDAQAKIDELASSAQQPTESPDASAIADLRQRIAKGTEAVQRAQAHSTLREQIHAAKKKQVDLAAHQGAIQKLIDYFGTEAKATLLQATIGAFTDSMNDVLKRWGYTATLSIEPWVFGVTFKDPAKGALHAVPLKMLSDSERYRFSTAFQVALAIVSGFNFVVVDWADVFDTHGRQMLYAYLTEKTLDQVIVIQTDERTAVPAMDEAAFYMFGLSNAAGDVPTTTVRRLSAGA